MIALRPRINIPCHKLAPVFIKKYPHQICAAVIQLFCRPAHIAAPLYVHGPMIEFIYSALWIRVFRRMRRGSPGIQSPRGIGAVFIPSARYTEQVPSGFLFLSSVITIFSFPFREPFYGLVVDASASVTSTGYPTSHAAMTTGSFIPDCLFMPLPSDSAAGEAPQSAIRITKPIQTVETVCRAVCSPYH